MTPSPPQSLKDRLHSENAETVLYALREIQRDEKGDIAPFLARLTELLRARDTDQRFIAANILNEAARRGRDIAIAIPMLEDLFSDGELPSWMRQLKVGKVNPVAGSFASVGRQAINAVAHHYRYRREEAAIRRLIAVGGGVAAGTLYALQSAERPQEIDVLVPVVLAEASSADPTIRAAAAALLTKYYWLAQQWDAVGSLIESDDERVRLAAIGTLDNLAEAAAYGKDYDLSPVLPHLLRVLAGKSTALKQTRVAAARVVVWLVLKAGEAQDSFVVDGLDLMTFTEVWAEVRKLKRFAAKHGAER